MSAHVLLAAGLGLGLAAWVALVFAGFERDARRDARMLRILVGMDADTPHERKRGWR